MALSLPAKSGQSDENNIHSTVVCDFHKGSSFLVYKNLPVREDSQIDFPTGNVFFCVWVLHKNVSQILATIDSSSGEFARKTLSVMKSFTGNIKGMRFKIFAGHLPRVFLCFWS